MGRVGGRLGRRLLLAAIACGLLLGLVPTMADRYLYNPGTITAGVPFVERDGRAPFATLLCVSSAGGRILPPFLDDPVPTPYPTYGSGPLSARGAL